MKICKKCIMLDTRPRLKFNDNGICAACEWDKIKKSEVDWQARHKELADLCDEIRGKQKYDCIVPASGGKDSTYVAHKMKNDFGLNVLTVTITPPLETELIQNNMKSFWIMDMIILRLHLIQRLRRKLISLVLLNRDVQC